jgi:hypothetical protein
MYYVLLCDSTLYYITCSHYYLTTVLLFTILINRVLEENFCFVCRTLKSITRYATYTSLKKNVFTNSLQGISLVLLYLISQWLFVGRPGAVVRAVSLSHQVMDSKQPFHICEWKACLDLSLPQTPLI